MAFLMVEAGTWASATNGGDAAGWWARAVT